jgi:hypothetical protein
LRLFHGILGTGSWLRYELAGCGIGGIGLFVLLINDPLRWKLDMNQVYALTFVGCFSFLVGGALIMVGDRKAKGAIGQGNLLKTDSDISETTQKCHLCDGSLYVAGRPHKIGGHSFCGECYNTIEDARKQERNS